MPISTERQEQPENSAGFTASPGVWASASAGVVAPPRVQSHGAVVGKVSSGGTALAMLTRGDD